MVLKRSRQPRITMVGKLGFYPVDGVNSSVIEKGRNTVVLQKYMSHEL